MIYKITFYTFTITAQDWDRLFKILMYSTWSFSSLRMVVLRYGRQIDFFILTKNKIDILNSRLYPFYLSDDIRDEEMALLKDEAAVSGVTPLWLKPCLIRTFEKKSLQGKEIYKFYFDFNRYNPFTYFPFIHIHYLQSGQKKSSFSLNRRHILSFLSFDLSNTVSAEIARVKPQLVADDLKLGLHPEGVLEIKNLSNNGYGQLSVRSYNFERHSLIVGQSGSGKSSFLKLLLEDLYKKMGDEYCVVLIDPHAALVDQMRTIPYQKVIDFKALATNLFINIQQPALSTELTLDLFSTILDVKGNQSLHRVLKYTLNLLYSIDAMSIENLKNVLTDSLARKELLKRTEDRNLLQFFETEYRELYTTKYSEAVLPIINLIAELGFISNAAAMTDLVQEMNNNFMVAFPIQQTSLGKNITRIVGGSLIQQVFTIAQAGLVRKKIVLVIDEVSVVQNPSLIHILSEARKFGLTLVLSQQYLMQVPVDVLQSIFANMVNYFSFKVSRDDAEMLARNLNCKVDEFSMMNKDDPREIQEVATKILMDLNPREVVVRVLANDHFYSPFKAKTVTINN